MRMISFSVIVPLINLHISLYVSGGCWSHGFVLRCNFCQGIFESVTHSLLFNMKLVIFAIAISLAASVHGIKTCKKIDACRCSTDEGEINLWSLAGQNPNGARLV